MASPLQLEALPEELLQHICGLLDSRRQSLNAFSRASKRCHNAALPTLCRRIRLVVRCEGFRTPTLTKPDLTPQVTDWLSMLDRRHASRHVRSLVVTQEDVEPTAPELPTPEYLSTVDRDDVLLLKPERACDWDMWESEYVTYPPREEVDQTWTQVSHLIGRLPNLASFTWDCSWPFPQILIGLLRHRPHISLHLDAFWFADKMRLENTQPTELSLLSYGGLQSVVTRSIEVGGDYTHEAIIDLISGINPSLKNLALLTERNQHSPGGFMLYESVRSRHKSAPWPGLHRRNVGVPYAKLQSLELGPLSIPLISTVLHKCNLADLKVLKLRVRYNYKGLEHIANSAQLPRLKVLVFGTDNSTKVQESEHGDKNLAVPFLTSLPALDAIRFNAQADGKILETTLEQHGPNLRRLWFAPPSLRNEVPFSPEHVAQIQRSCPLLEDLAISIPRSLGDKVEVGIYRELGRLSRLRRLSLYLDCNDSKLLVGDNQYKTEAVHYADFDLFDKEHLANPGIVDTSDTRQLRNGHIRHAMINAALDKHLAKAIFNAISASKPGLPTDFRLQRLELRPIRGDYYLSTRNILTYLSQCWLVEAFNIDPVVTPIRSPGDCDLSSECPELTLREKSVETIFRKIWPKKSPDSCWFYDWSSLPLRTEQLEPPQSSVTT